MSFLKIALLGDFGVGKTSLCTYFQGNYTSYDDFSVFQFTVDDTKYEVTETRHSIIENNYDAAIVMFDVTNKKSYDSSRKLYNMVLHCYPKIPIVVVGNKSEGDKKESGELEISVKNGESAIPFRYLRDKIQ